MADTNTRTPAPTGIRGFLPRRGVVSSAMGTIREKMSGLSLIKSTGIGAFAGIGIVIGKGVVTGDFTPSVLLDVGIIGTGAGLGVVHAVAHGVLEHGVDGATEAIHHNRTCDQIENSLCQNPELLQAAAQERAAAYQFNHEPPKNETTQRIIEETEARRAAVPGMTGQLQAEAAAGVPSGRGL